MKSKTPSIDPAFHLAKGAHGSLEAGACLLEYESYLAGEKFSDRPKCVDPVLAAYGRSLNDRLPDEERQKLKRFNGRLMGTADDGKSAKRSWMAADHFLRVVLPSRYELTELQNYADQLRALPEIVDSAGIDAAKTIVRDSRDFSQNRLRNLIAELKVKYWAAGAAGAAWAAGAAGAAGAAWAAWAAGAAGAAGAAWAAVNSDGVLITRAPSREEIIQRIRDQVGSIQDRDRAVAMAFFDELINA